MLLSEILVLTKNAYIRNVPIHHITLVARDSPRDTR